MKNYWNHWKICILFFSFVFMVMPAIALTPTYKDFWGKAIRGYDPVAYFTQGKPVEGEKKIQYKWNEANWYFSSKENLQAFIKEPKKYAPQYGGYCAWAVSQGYTASIDPEAWKIHNGKLYLNYSKDVQKTWSGDIPGNVKKADKNWPELLNK